MERPTEIGTSIVVKGEITANEAIVVSGRVEGSIAAFGHAVTVNAGAELVADIQARAIVVSGQVFGTLCADERIELGPTANVEGELTAPAFQVKDGAVFQGKAETTKAAPKAGLQLAS
jgi:cytoskeletal protein CcmA (bactofilin family)